MIELTDSIQSIERKVNKAIAEEMNILLMKKKPSIERECKKLVSSWILAQPEIQSLRSSTPDSLSGQFGLIPGADEIAVKDIISAVEDSISASVSRIDDKLNGGILVYFQPSTFTNLLGLTSGHVYYAKGDLHWLDWLLTEGDRIIVVNYSYEPGLGLGRSRLGHMTKTGTFRVPPEFSGTVQNNFITRALIGKGQESDIFNVFKKALS